MPQGLQVWDEQGNLILDTSDRVLKYLTVDDVVEGTTTDIPLAPDATSAVVAAPVGNLDRNFTPEITYIGNTARVTWNSGSAGLTRDISFFEF